MSAALPGFAHASTLLILAPGPDSLLVLRNTLRHGRRAGWVTASGALSGLLAWAVAAAFGLSAPLVLLALGLWFIAETGVWLATLAWMAARGAGWLGRSAVQRTLERVTGIALIGFGLRLAAAAR
jgi:threonine/homoserine/homoserine lactone efflux protein